LCFICLLPLHCLNQLSIPSIGTSILQGDNCPYRRRNPSDQRNLQDQAYNSSQYSASKHKGEKREEDGYQGHFYVRDKFLIFYMFTSRFGTLCFGGKAKHKNPYYFTKVQLKTLVISNAI